MTPEGKVKELVKSILDKRRPSLYYFMPVPSGYGVPTLDIIGCYYCRFFAIETKAPGKHPTPRQQGTIADMFTAGGAVFVVTGAAGVGPLEEWLVEVERVSI